jgi:hypothetical protein
MLGSPDEFTFVDAGRTFVCCVEPLRGRSGEAWWWFRVSSELHQRFAPFRAASSDSPTVVRERILAYYDGLLARRAAPVTMGWGRTRGAVRPVATAPTSLPAAS